MKFKFEKAILYEDDHFLVVDKPPFIATLADRQSDQNLQLLAKHYNDQLIACHRLDKETSGVLLMAKGEDAYRHASLQFEHRKINKTYHAVVEGLPEFVNEVLDFPILPLSRGKVRIDLRKGKPSNTLVNTIEVFKQHSLVECKPTTGRMHQIRIHLSRKEAPIVNDELYGGTLLYLSKLKRNYHLKKGVEERPLIQRFALHAKSIGFDNFSEQITVESDYPKDMNVLLKQLRQNK